MQTSAQPKNIVLGRGVFKIDGTAIGLTRDGGNFTVEYEYREIKADGDRGPVKGRVVKDGARPKLTISHLELLRDFEKLHPGVSKTATAQNVTLAGTTLNDTDDYHTVTFNGETKDGKAVTITVSNAINLENINLDLKEKDEVIDSVTFQGTYVEDSEEEPWSIVYGL